MSRSRREEFYPPPKAPVFEPSAEEFKDPLAYINKIRPAAERVGICKIRPPKDWVPPFAVDLEAFKFVPRVQRLNELEAHSRVKMNFLSALSKFWELQGTTLKQPQIEGFPLDLHELWKVVLEEGGYEHVMVSKKWSQVAKKMGYKKLQHSSFSVRQHYEKILYPYCVFRAVEMPDVSCSTKTRGYATSAMSTHSLASTQRHKTLRSAEGASQHVLLDDNNKVTTASSDAAVGYSDKPAICKVCDKRGDKDRLLVCDNCLACIHTFCLITPLPAMPTGGWQCPSCIAAECSKKQESYGFEESQESYTLETFGDMANRYKCQYFQIPSRQPQSVPPELVEKEFWRLVESSDDQVVVQYGADLHSSKHGSGFPFGNRVFTDEDIAYSESPWNLNNLPNLESSVLRHVTADISGMKVPWLYVGMCFSSFCWHNEDHWSYSINYLHWGEPKVWYGVPGHAAEKFEKVMESAVPELFRDHPDLLHHLVTLVSPTLLMKHRVPVVSTNQCAGEFVVTFPRAYHAGFNQGFNFAEAVNFCPADWIRNGRGCVDHYRQMRRYTVFSHDELICRMALNLSNMDLHIAEAVDGDLAVLLARETELRTDLTKSGVNKEECESFELLPDDERQCCYCQTLCFLSGISCRCRPDRLACLFHVKELCACAMSDKCLRYRYTLSQIQSMKTKVETRAQKYVAWSREVEQLLDAEGSDRPTVATLKRLASDAAECNLSAPDLTEEIQLAIDEAEACATDAVKLINNKDTPDTARRLTLADLEQFMKRLDRLPCLIEEGDLVQDLLRRVQMFQMGLRAALSDPTPSYARLTALLDEAKSLDVELPQLSCVEQKLQQAQWLESARKMVDVRNSEPGASLEQVEELIASGTQHLPHSGVEEARRHLEGLVKLARQWEQRASTLVEEKPTVSHLQSLLSEVDHLPINVPSLTNLKNALKEATQWSKEATTIQDSDISPDLENLEVLLSRARSIPLQLEQLAQIESLVAAAQGWRDRACRAFLKKSITNSCTLLQVLYPRLDLSAGTGGEGKAAGAAPDLSSTTRAMPADREAALLARLAGEELAGMRGARHTRLAATAESLACVVRGELPPADGLQHCACRRPVSGAMLLCELCLDWFHVACVHLPRSKLPTAASTATWSSGGVKDEKSATTGGAGGAGAGAPPALKENKFLCLACVRSRRPRLDTVLSLLVSLRKVPVRLTEGQALQALTERAMHWQERARGALAEAAAILERQSPAAAAALLNLLQPGGGGGGSTAVAAASSMAAAAIGAAAAGGVIGGNPSATFMSRSSQLPPGLVAAATQAAPCKSQLRSTAPLGRPSSSSSAQSQMLPVIRAPAVPLPVARPLSAVAVDDARGLAALFGLSGADVEASQRSAAAPGSLDLPANVRGHLEALMMQGDLLEVCMDETQQLWQLLQLCTSTKDSAMIVNLPASDDFSKDDRRRKKKRRHDDDVDAGNTTVAHPSSPGQPASSTPAALPSAVPSSPAAGQAQPVGQVALAQDGAAVHSMPSLSNHAASAAGGKVADVEEPSRKRLTVTQDFASGDVPDLGVAGGGDAAVAYSGAAFASSAGLSAGLSTVVAQPMDTSTANPSAPHPLSHAGVDSRAYDSGFSSFLGNSE